MKHPVPINRHAKRQESVTYNLNGNKSIRTDPEIREMVEFADKHFKRLLYICQGIPETHENEKRNQCYKKNQMNILVLSNILLRT